MDETFVSYIKPGACGNRSSVRWVAVTADDGSGLLVAAAGEEQKLHMSAHRFTDDDAHAASHPHEIAKREEVYLSVDK